MFYLQTMNKAAVTLHQSSPGGHVYQRHMRMLCSVSIKSFKQKDRRNSEMGAR